MHWCSCEGIQHVPAWPPDVLSLHSEHNLSHSNDGSWYIPDSQIPILPNFPQAPQQVHQYFMSGVHQCPYGTRSPLWVCTLSTWRQRSSSMWFPLPRCILHNWAQAANNAGYFCIVYIYNTKDNKDPVNPQAYLVVHQLIDCFMSKEKNLINSLPWKIPCLFCWLSNLFSSQLVDIFHLPAILYACIWMEKNNVWLAASVVLALKRNSSYLSIFTI